MGGDSYIKGCWFKYQQHILDGLFSHLFLVKIVIFVWRGPKINENRPGMARLKKRCNLLLIYCSHRLLACLPPAESLFLPQRWFKAQRRRKKFFLIQIEKEKCWNVTLAFSLKRKLPKTEICFNSATIDLDEEKSTPKILPPTLSLSFYHSLSLTLHLWWPFVEGIYLLAYPFNRSLVMLIHRTLH